VRLFKAKKIFSATGPCPSRFDVSSSSSHLMKLTVGATLIAALAAVVSACEPECRHGLATAFSDKYYEPIAHTIQLLKPELTNFKLNVPSQISAAVSEQALKAGIETGVTNAINKMINTVTGDSLDKLYYSEMFNGPRSFKGDCNNPKRVDRRMPPPGESWTLEECKLIPMPLASLIPHS
jgi:hypothetical protein